MTSQRLKSKVVRSKDAPPLDGPGATGSRQSVGMQQQQNQQQHRQQQQQRGLPPHLRGAGGGNISGNGRPSSRGAFQGGPRPGMRPGSGAPMHGSGGQQQGAYPGSMHSGGMPGGIVGGPHGGGGGGGAQMSGWAGMNPAAARAMLLAQQQGQPWGNEQLPLFQDLPTGALLHSVSGQDVQH